MCLINLDGSIFPSKQLETIRNELDSLNKKEREEYRNINAEKISKCDASKIVIVSGPGTGKSYLFLSRISHWFEQTQDARILVTSFVRKLVTDLDNDVQLSPKFTEDDKKKTTVITLHKLARSHVERNHGTSSWRFQSYFVMLGEWKVMFWNDVRAFHEKCDPSEYTLKGIEHQMYEDSFNKDPHWQSLKQTYFRLCKFYNSSGFADLIIRAKVATQENSLLNDRTHFIVDEYQDFNQAEQNLILELIKDSKSVLIVGDDEQVLYEDLKAGRRQLIRDLYQDKQ
ncbi:MAG: AAA family ATPase [candidate division Zixibacteria bacterium]|nr:AAA family ATPase [candidate division Zixibacteria bacterium]